jgi:ribosomal protein S18 acetylase RimI-like enzyme
VTAQHEVPARIGPLAREHRSRVRDILCATGAFHEDEVNLALELFDETFVAPSAAAVATAAPVRAADDYEFIGSFRPDGSLTGYACFGQTPGTSGTFDLYWIAVDPAHHGAGVGTRLLEEMERQLAERRARLFVVETSSRDDYAGTRRFYHRRGYAVSARIADFYGPGDDRVIFTKRVSLSHPSDPAGLPASPRPNPEFTRHE